MVRSAAMTDPQKVRLPVAEGAEAEIWVQRAAQNPARRTTLVLAHGAGGDVDETTLEAIAAGAVDNGIDAVRLRFPYRVAGRNAPDTAPKLEAAFRTVVRWAKEELSAGQVVVGGRSMGGRIASLMAVAGEPVTGLMFISYPLHPAGKEDKLRDTHLYVLQRPMLFVQGDRDALCRMPLMKPVIARLGERATLHVVEGGDHSFKVLKRSGRTTQEAHAEVIATALSWLRDVV
jgi:predicted alpha/beta-hydrolase family hydrolase